ncbi:carbohydrate kinase [Cylindrobasidium torrendii FP15055 ss-10]|uniref:Gluconokinase n=1 Tax=Cylindrobasidium torrendii FP15055 ss-10 TaxID=1314674 RepID=A0A0D7BUI9_9AGAR|nr:carbohydrate kinase [Cylindrobasidium torrendii FP15055 ss-10]
MADLKPCILIVMGVSGTGKTTLGEALATTLGVPFIDGDDLHTPENRAKMGAGTPLTDEDREPWLKIIRNTGVDGASKGGVVLACSSLRAKYRDILRGKEANDTTAPTYFVFVKGSRELIWERMQRRQNHYMKASMLDSQLATLEDPEGEPDVVKVEAIDSTEVQHAKAIETIRALRARNVGSPL